MEHNVTGANAKLKSSHIHSILAQTYFILIECLIS